MASSLCADRGRASMAASGDLPQDWARKLFARSPLKQEKLRRIVGLLPSLEGKRCLDIGSDNGVISLLLRERGGSWCSADLIPETVEAIRALVGNDVFQISGTTTPFRENSFDVVVVVDLLEHLETDAFFIKELYRITRPGGVLILNVPNPTEGWLRRLRFALGQTDAAHGHVRPGYSPPALRNLCAGYFAIDTEQHYSRTFSALADTLITGALKLLRPGSATKKGSVITATDLGTMRKSYALFGLVAPFLQLMVRCDGLLADTSGEMLIARARSLKAG